LRQLSDHQSKLLQATLENMDQGVMMIDADGIVQVYNSKILELLDLPEELLAHRPWRSGSISFDKGSSRRATRRSDSG
jgi:PAS domain-containing protein